MSNIICKCRCCLSNDAAPLSQYQCKNDAKDSFFDKIKEVYPDIQLSENIPSLLCNKCQSLMQDAICIKQYLAYQERNEPCQKLLLKDDTCSSCLAISSPLCERQDDNSETYIDTLRKIFPESQFDTHISFKYCNSCSKYISSAFQMKQNLITNNSLYEKYCSSLSNFKNINSHDLTPSNFEEVFVKDETVAKADLAKGAENNEEEIKKCHAEEKDSEEYTINFKLEECDENSQVEDDDKIIKCNICQKQFNHKSNLRVHQRIHTGEKPFKCCICPMSFSQTSTLKAHKRIHTGEKPYKCNVCEKSFTESGHLRVHERIHTGQKPYECNFCRKSFSDKSYLKTHKRTHTGEKPFKCNRCQMSFSRSYRLKSHERVHTGERPYKCNVCDMSFSRTTHLKAHEQNHSEERRYKCDVCQSSFSQRFLLTRHSKRVHTGEKPYKCKVCEKSFSESSHLKTHERIHTGEKPYKCNFCEMTFSRNDYLKSHERNHTEKNPFKCNVCPSSFGQRFLLSRHNKRVHNLEDLTENVKC